MQVGTYIDGRELTYDEATRAFAVGGTPVTLAQVLEYDAAGQIQWPSAEMRTWAHQLNRPDPHQGLGRLVRTRWPDSGGSPLTDGRSTRLASRSRGPAPTPLLGWIHVEPARLG